MNSDLSLAALGRASSKFLHRYRFVNGEIEDEPSLGSFGTDFAVCRSRDEIFIDTYNTGNVKVNIVP